MSLEKKDVHSIAFLSRLSLDSEEEAHYARELTVIVDWFEKLNGADTAGIEPMISPVEHAMVLREDKVVTGDLGSVLTACAPDAKYGYYAVPKVME